MPPRKRRSAAGASTASSRGAPQVKKSKKEAVLIDDIAVQFEWEGDKSKWVQYPTALNKKIAEAYTGKKKQVEVEVAPGVKMVVLLDEMLQQNKKTGFKRRLRIAVRSDEGDDFMVIEGQGKARHWDPFDIGTSLELEQALTQKKKSVSTSLGVVDLQKMTFTSSATKTATKIRRELQASEPSQSDEEDEDAKDEEKEEEEEEEVKVKSTKGKSSKKSGKSNGASSETKSTVRTVVMKKGGAPVDTLCPIASKCSVYEKGRDIWDCMLNQTNIGNNNNKYYLIQVLKTDGKEDYHCWQRWGRVGYSGQNNLVSCGTDLQSAMKTFEKKFNDKTGNAWANRKSFVKRGGKYDLLEMDYSTEGKEDMEVDETPTDVDKEKKKVPDSTLDKRVQDLVQLICDIKSMEDEIVEMKYDTKKAPLGKLTKDQINAGYSALKDIETLINKNDFGNNLKEACSDFYTRIPHVFGMQVPPLIRTPQDVKKKLQLLEALEDIEIAIKLLKGGDMSENPIDRHYHQLKCEMVPLDHTSDTFKMVNNYLLTTHASTHNYYRMELEDAFELDKEMESSKFKDHGNRMLLWHGSRLTNWAGILGQGLRIAPPEAPVTGYMFGKGVYFADMSSKSANYCFATKTRSTGVVVLCDVSLGQMNELMNADPKAANLPSGKHSVKGLGRVGPNEKTHITMNDGLVVPVGKETNTNVVQSKTGYSLNYNEFIVYDTSQIRMKYLLKVKFHFK